MASHGEGATQTPSLPHALLLPRHPVATKEEKGPKDGEGEEWKQRQDGFSLVRLKFILQKSLYSHFIERRDGISADSLLSTEETVKFQSTGIFF